MVTCEAASTYCINFESLHCNTEQKIYERLLVKTKKHLVTKICRREHPHAWNNLDKLKIYTPSSLLFRPGSFAIRILFCLNLNENNLKIECVAENIHLYGNVYSVHED